MTDRLERLLNLVIALRETRRPMTAAEIRERVSGYGQPDPESFRRMFERDKADLRDLGVPVDTAPLDRWDDRQGYRIDPRRYDLPEVSLEPDELAALAVALEATGLRDEAGTGLLKLGVGSGEPLIGAEGSAGLGIGLDAPHRDVLLQAQLQRETVRFDYRPAGRDPASRTVDPYGLVHRRGRWYLVGHDHDRGERRAFRLDRITGEVRTVGGPGAFEPPPASEITTDDVVPAPRDGTPEVATVAAAPEVAWQVARRARGGGTEAADGTTTFTVAVGDRDAFRSWVLGFGPDLLVLEPAELRDDVVAALRRMAPAS